MIIGGYAIGAKQGFIYIRAEYPLAIRRLEKAIAMPRSRACWARTSSARASIRHRDPARRRGVRLRRGDGADPLDRGRARHAAAPAAVSGGPGSGASRRSSTTSRPSPTCRWSSWTGRSGSPHRHREEQGHQGVRPGRQGRNTGLVEVPMGTTLREVVYDVGGGIPNGKKFKAVQTGGPAGGCLPESFLDTPVDYDTLAAAGSHHGQRRHDRHDEDDLHGGRGPVLPGLHAGRVVRQVHALPRGHQAHAGDPRAHHEGKGEGGRRREAPAPGDTVKRASLCGLGQAAPNPVISTITHFRDEYDAHIREKRCPAGVCRSADRLRHRPEKCTGCGCRRNCPVNCITGEPRKST
jgi:NADP-reducing hydrogenase subunit HndC